MDISTDAAGNSRANYRSTDKTLHQRQPHQERPHQQRQPIQPWERERQKRVMRHQAELLIPLMRGLKPAIREMLRVVARAVYFRGPDGFVASISQPAIAADLNVDKRTVQRWMAKLDPRCFRKLPPQRKGADTCRYLFVSPIVRQPGGGKMSHDKSNASYPQHVSNSDDCVKAARKAAGAESHQERKTEPKRTGIPLSTVARHPACELFAAIPGLPRWAVEKAGSFLAKLDEQGYSRTVIEAGVLQSVIRNITVPGADPIRTLEFFLPAINEARRDPNLRESYVRYLREKLPDAIAFSRGAKLW